MTSLTGKQKAFAEYYVATLNATESARRAGYKAKDDNSLSTIGYENLRKLEIRAYIDELLDAQNMSTQEIIGRLVSQARSDVGDFIDPTSMTLNFRYAQERGISHLIKKIKQTLITNEDQQTEIFEFELYDAQKALEHLGKAKNLFGQKVELTGKDGAPLQAPVVYLPTVASLDDLETD